MDKDEYKKMLQAYAQPVEFNGAIHYINTKMNGDALSIMQDDDRTQTERTICLIACVLCDASGVRIFDGNDKADMAIIKSFDVELQGKIVLEATRAFFPDEKKTLKEPAQNSLLYSLKSWASQFVSSLKV